MQLVLLADVDKAAVVSSTAVSLVDLDSGSTNVVTGLKCVAVVFLLSL